MNVLIVGGSSDLGISLGNYLYDNGYKVIATYNKNKVINNNIEYIKCDITNNEDIDNMFGYLTDKYKTIDILINMASIYDDDEFLNLTKESFMKALEVNVVGNFMVCQAYARMFHNGKIINIASTDGIDTYNKYNTIYASSKAALINMSKCISLGTDNCVICLCPNWIDTNSTRLIDKDYLDSELKRINQPRLITIDEFLHSIDDVINNNIESGSVLRLDFINNSSSRGDKVCLEKIQ